VGIVILLLRAVAVLLAATLRLLIGKERTERLLDMTGVCRCVWCCTFEEGWQPCNGKAPDGQPVCDWCAGAQRGEYSHCHGFGNAMLKEGWKLGRPQQQRPAH